jgi:hypothetical protein
MDALASYRRLVRKKLMELTQVPYAHGHIELETVFDPKSDRYLVMILGRENQRRVHGCLVHVDIIDGKLWIQRDGTEQGLANEFIEAGVPKEHIVLGFRSPEMRKHTGLAIA